MAKPSKLTPAVGEHHEGSFGIYMAHKQSKLHSQYGSNFASSSSRKSDIFSGVSVYFNGRMDPPQSVLMAMLGAHGGAHQQYLSRHGVTHIVAANLPDSKIKEELKKKRWMPYVKPAWIVDSVKAGKRLPVDPYLLDCFKENEGGTKANAQCGSSSSSAATAGNSGIVSADVNVNVDGTELRIDDVSTIDVDTSVVEIPPEEQSAPPSASAAAAASGSSTTGTHLLAAGGGKVSSSSASSSSSPSVAGTTASATVGPRSSGNDPNFLGSFLSSSRLHFIGAARAHVTTLVAQEKQKVWGAAAAEGSSSASSSSSSASTAAATIAGSVDADNVLIDGVAPASRLGDYQSGSDNDEEETEADRSAGGSSDDESGRRTATSTSKGRGTIRKSAALSAASSSAPSARGPRVIVHVDIDCFFAQVALLDAPPHLKDQPVVVAHSGGRPGHMSLTSSRAAFGDGVDTSSSGSSRKGGAAANAASGGMVIAGMYVSNTSASSSASIATPIRQIPAAAAASGADGDGISPARLAEDDGAGDVSTGSGSGTGRSPMLARGKEDNKSYPEYTASYTGGEVSSANYPARAFGIYAGMSVGEARKLCPHLTVLPYNFAKIESVSEAVFRRFASLTPFVAPISCDEAYLDLSHLALTMAAPTNSTTAASSVPAAVSTSSSSSVSASAAAPPPRSVVDAVAQLRADIFAETGVTVSAGIGPNMLLARLATSKAKPNGMFVLPQDAAAVSAFLAASDVTELPGVGWATGRALAEQGIATVGDLQKVPKPTLQSWLGPGIGESLWRYARGQDDRPVVTSKPRQSIGVETNWGIRFTTAAQVHAFLGQLGCELANRMAVAGREAATLAGMPEAQAAAAEPVKGRSLTLKVMQRQADAPNPLKFLGHGRCDSYSRTLRLHAPTCDAAALTSAAVKLYDQLGCPPDQLRGVGIQLKELSHRALDAAVSQAAAAGGQGLMDRFLTAIAAKRHQPKQHPQSNESDGDLVRQGASDDQSHRGEKRVRWQRDDDGEEERDKDGAGAADSDVIDLLDDEEVTGDTAMDDAQTGGAAAAGGVMTFEVDEDMLDAGGEASRDSHASKSSNASTDSHASKASTATVGSATDAAGQGVTSNVNTAAVGPPSPDDVIEILDTTQPEPAVRSSLVQPSKGANAPLRPQQQQIQQQQQLQAQPPAKRRKGASGAPSSSPTRLAQLSMIKYAASTATAEQLLAELTSAGVSDVTAFVGLPVKDLQEIFQSVRSRQARIVAADGAYRSAYQPPAKHSRPASAASSSSTSSAPLRSTAPVKQSATSTPHDGVISLVESQPSPEGAEAPMSNIHHKIKSSRPGTLGTSTEAAAAALQARILASIAAATAAGSNVKLSSSSSKAQSSALSSAAGSEIAIKPTAASSSSAAGSPSWAVNDQVKLFSSATSASGEEVQAVLQAGKAAFAREDAGAVAVALQQWMQGIGPFPLPTHARMLSTYVVDRMTAYAGEDAIALVRCLRRYCAAIDAERERALANPSHDPELLAVWSSDAASGNGATWADVLRHVEASLQEAAVATHGHRIDLELGF